MHDYEEEIYLARPSLFAQRVIFEALAAVGRLLGYQAEYPYPQAERREASPTARLLPPRDDPDEANTLLE